MQSMSWPLAAVIVLSSVVGVGKDGSKGAFEAIPFLKCLELYQMYPITRNETYIVKYTLIMIIINEHLKELHDVRCLRWGVFLGCSIKAHYHMTRMRVVLRQRAHGVHKVCASTKVMACSIVQHSHPVAVDCYRVLHITLPFPSFFIL